MKEVFDNLYVGDDQDFKSKVKHRSTWAVVQACREPYHRQALGYSGRSAPKSHPEYLVAKRGNRLILNMLDPPDPSYIPREIVDASLSFIHKKLTSGRKVLVHCNQGRSRSAGIALLYMANQGHISNDSLQSAEAAFRKLYPKYSPAAGMRAFIRMNWTRYMKKKL